MIEPLRAIVRPRAYSPATRATLPLEDLVIDGALYAKRQPVQIIGGPGSGKTTALRHLCAVLPDMVPADWRGQIDFLDEPEYLHSSASWVIFTAADALPGTERALRIQLVAWDEDDLMTYLLARHKESCAPVMAGLRQVGDALKLQGIPELWTMTLDYLAERAQAVPSLIALREAFTHRCDDADLALAAGNYCLALLLEDKGLVAKQVEILKAADRGPEWLRLLRHPPLRQILATFQIATHLATGKQCKYLQKPLPRPVIELVAEQIRGMPKAVANVKGFLVDKLVERHAMAASICHRLDRQWLCSFPRSTGTPLPTLTRACLDHADWPGVDLSDAKLSAADLSHANLAGASLVRAVAARTNFRGADLREAKLIELVAKLANFTDADLRQVQASSGSFCDAVFHNAKLDGGMFFRANLSHGDFTNASLVNGNFWAAFFGSAILAYTDCTGATFVGAKFERADFRTSRIDKTCWKNALLIDCNLEELSATIIDFSEAILSSSLLTASVMPGANFTGADLKFTGLADIDWERAVLRGADLRGASFHLGSSRSGKVGSPIAREGSMTGFYTDDYAEQDFKAPEEIRKANLRGADLRGANIEGVDFYLVDLRDALYDAEQAVQFRATDAILEYRAP